MSDADLRYEHDHHSWKTYLALTGKRDLKGTGMNEEERLAAQPQHQYWQDRATSAAQAVRSRIGLELHRRLLSGLPETADNWSPQQWAFAFERVAAHLDALPIGAAPDLSGLVIAALAAPIRPHPYEMARLRQECPTCGLAALPWQLDGRGWEYLCDAGHSYTVSTPAALQTWLDHLEAIRSRLGDIR